ncbi:glutathione S-transferase family protein [Sorangium sp. So ce118]
MLPSHDDGVLVAILTWLELRHPEPSLLPGGRQARARALAWAQESEETSVVYEPIEQLFLASPTDLSGEQREAIRGALSTLRFEPGLWEARLCRQHFLVADGFSIADCAFYPVLAYLERRGLVLDGVPVDPCARGAPTTRCRGEPHRLSIRCRTRCAQALEQLLHPRRA